jgi:hypothetical protein
MLASRMYRFLLSIFECCISYYITTDIKRDDRLGSPRNPVELSFKLVETKQTLLPIYELFSLIVLKLMLSLQGRVKFLCITFRYES